MAPPAKPLELHAIDGTLRADRHGDGTLDVGRPVDLLNAQAPPYFDDAQRDAWADLAAIVHPKVTQVSDLIGVEMMSVSLAEFRMATAQLALPEGKGGGMFVKSPNGYRVAHPAIAVRSKAASEYRAWASKFGLTPADRVALGVTAAKEKTGDKVTSRIGASPRGRKT